MNQTETIDLDLADLASGAVPEIHEFLGNMLARAAIVCLESQGHQRSVALTVISDKNYLYTVSWFSITDNDRRFFNDAERATEDGAICIAAMLAKSETGYSVIKSSRKGTGFDYWLGEKSDATMQRKARLEVSGMRRGTESEVRARVRLKIDQIGPSASMFPGMPGYVVVVEFGTPLAQVEKQ